MSEELSPRRKLACWLFVIAVSWFAVIGFVVSMLALVNAIGGVW